MKTGLQLIASERCEQIHKHKRTIQNDVDNNPNGELCWAASLILYSEDQASTLDMLGPTVLKSWDQQILKRMDSKSYKDRLIIAGALICAELDRLQKLNE